MEMMAVDPLKVVIAPRFWAGIVAIADSGRHFSAVGIFGGYVVGVHDDRRGSGRVWSQMQDGIDVWSDVGNGVVKSLVFWALPSRSSPVHRVMKPARRAGGRFARTPRKRWCNGSLPCLGWISC